MAGESVISEGDIERRASELETKQKTEADAAAAAATKTKEGENGNAAPETTKETPDPKVTKVEKKLPDDPRELRKWNTKVSMELADVNKRLETLASMLSAKQKEKVDWKELSKDPVKLQQMIEKREQELVSDRDAKFNDHFVKSQAAITEYESKLRSYDKENYPRWAELIPVMRALSEPRPGQENGDPRVNFNQDPKLVLDSLYELAQEVVEGDPKYKKPEIKAASTGKTYTQEEVDAQIAKVKEDALAQQSSNLKQELKGAGVGGMGKGSSKGKPGEVDKDVLWNMPLNDLGTALRRATENLNAGR